MSNKQLMLAAGLVGWSMLFLYVGLYPFEFEWPSEWCFEIGFRERDAARNFIAFIPFGLMMAPLYRRSPLLATALFCFALSASVEMGQQLIPRRDPSISDLVTNTLGGLSGAWALLALERWRRARQQGLE